MAESPAHRFGQVIGNLIEEILQPVLQEFADQRKLFLDKHGGREGVRSGRRLSWKDDYGNSHDLDFVIEKTAAPGVQGRPVAFIEAAWRRYTKHSKNKAQEIQGAILPIAEKHKWDRPFLGAVLAGEFTRPSLDQLTSSGFTVVYLPYDAIVSAFRDVGIDSRFDEDTSDRDFAHCVDRIDELSEAERQRLKSRIVELNREGFDVFFAALRRKPDSLIDRVTVLPLFGVPCEFDSIHAAAQFINGFDPGKPATEFQKYEIVVRFSNQDKIDGLFSQRAQALRFLERVSS